MIKGKGRKFAGGATQGKAKRRVFLLEDMNRLGAWDNEEEETNEVFLQKLLRAVRYAVQSELTQCQQSCFLLYFEEGLTVRQIARRLGVGDSTASRHLAAARKKVQRCARYCVVGNAPGGKDGETRFFGAVEKLLKK